MLSRSAAVAALVLGSLALAPPSYAGHAKVVFKHGRLSVVGTAKGDKILVVRGASSVKVKVNGKAVKPSHPVKPAKLRSVVVKGGSGNDTISLREHGGALPSVSIDGGNGDDVITGGAGVGTVLLGGEGNDTLTGGAGEVHLFAGPGNDTLAAGPSSHAWGEAGSGDDTILGGSGVSEFTGDDGNDTAVGGSGSFSVVGGAGNDHLTGGAGSSQLEGDIGDDTLTGGTGAVVEHGGGGDDTLRAGSSSSTQADGGDGADHLTGGAGAASLEGDDGADVIVAGTGPTTMTGDAGNDDLTAGVHTTQMAGGDNDDHYRIDADLVTGNLELAEGGDQDTDLLDFSTTGTTAVHLDLSATGPQPTGPTIQLLGATGFENVIGGAVDDVLAGNTRTNTFTGGAGQDTFVHHGLDDGIDTVTDMSAAHGDQVRFQTGGALAATALTLNAAATSLRGTSGGYGFDFTVPVLNAASSYVFGTTDTSPAGELITFGGTGGFSQSSNVDSLISATASNGATIGGAGGNDRIIDASPNGNSLIGRDGQDFMFGGDGVDTLQGDRGFAPGVADRLTGGNGADTFLFGEAFGGGASETFGDDTILDFGNGADTVDLFTGLSVKAGLGSATVTIWNGATDFGTISAANGHLWTAGDFT